MAKLYITEYAKTGHGPNGPAPVGLEPEVNSQTVAIAGASASSAAFANSTQLVRLHADAICSVVFAASPTATANNRRMAANQTEYFQVPPGAGLSVAVIANV